jgi:hypothetical protein
MANEEHVALLRKGVNAWNKWRKENPEVLPNLRGANLMNTSLVDANLRGADLIGAYLGGADLRRTNFMGAYLIQVNLNGAYLGGADAVLGSLSL